MNNHGVGRICCCGRRHCRLATSRSGGGRAINVLVVTIRGGGCLGESSIILLENVGRPSKVAKQWLPHGPTANEQRTTHALVRIVLQYELLQALSVVAK